MENRDMEDPDEFLLKEGSLLAERGDCLATVNDIQSSSV
jgi:hypothetical protein